MRYKVVAAGVPQIVGIDRDGLCPTEGRQAHECQEDGEKNGADRINMGQGVDADPAQVVGRWVSHFIGGPSVRRFVNRNGEQNNKNLDDDGYYIHFLTRGIYSISGAL